MRPIAPLPIAAAILFIFFSTLSVAAQDAAEPTHINATPPTAEFTIDPPQGVVGTIFFFDALPSSDNEDADAWLLVRFDFEDDGTWDTVWLNPTNAPWRHSYTTPATYTVRLEVKDRDELTDTITHTIVVDDPGTNTPPVAACNVSPSAGPPGTTFTFEATGTTDAQDAIGNLSAKWDPYGGLDFRGQSWQSATLPVTFTYTSLGLHQMDVIIMDAGNLMDTAECEVEIEPAGGNTAPTAGMSISPTHGTTADPFTFDMQSSRDNEDALAALSVRFDWTDDGMYDTGWLNASQTWAHTFSDVVGPVTVRAQVRDSGGLTDEITETVTVFFQMLLPHLAAN